VNEGLYTLSRNPTFLGQTALLVGAALALPTIPGFIAALLFFGSAQLQIRSEEKALLQTHGEAFKSFCAQTPRWIRSPLKKSTKE
jgi:protein-S-isoprenylcysteine O-methyltransferase Ste14